MGLHLNPAISSADTLTDNKGIIHVIQLTILILGLCNEKSETETDREIMNMYLCKRSDYSNHTSTHRAVCFGSVWLFYLMCQISSGGFEHLQQMRFLKGMYLHCQ